MMSCDIQSCVCPASEQSYKAEVNKKLGDIIDDLEAQHQHHHISQITDKKVLAIIHELETMNVDLQAMADDEPIDTELLTDKQERLNAIEQQAKQGVYGSASDAIPAGQAMIRRLVENNHQVIRRILERAEEGSVKVKSIKSTTD